MNLGSLCNVGVNTIFIYLNVLLKPNSSSSNPTTCTHWLLHCSGEWIPSQLYLHVHTRKNGFYKSVLHICFFFFWSPFSYNLVFPSLTLLEIKPPDRKHRTNSHPDLKSQNIVLIVWMKNLPPKSHVCGMLLVVLSGGNINSFGGGDLHHPGWTLRLLSMILLLVSYHCFLCAHAISLLPAHQASLIFLLSWCVYHDGLSPSAKINQNNLFFLL